MGKKVLIVGGVAGGASAAARLRRLEEDTEIILLERDGYISFANCGLPYYIGDTIKERNQLLIQTPQSFHARFKVDVRINSEVVAVDAINKKIKIDSKTRGIYEESYDYLVLSPGAKSIKPNIPGIESNKIFTLRNIPDMDKIKASIDKGAKSAVVIGGGYVGVEMAENLRNKGLQVTLVEAALHILAPFDTEMVMIAEKVMQEKGIDLLLGDGVKGFNDKEDFMEIILKSDTKLKADVVILAIGVMPDTHFLKDSGIALRDRGHIIVDDKMATNMEGIYAVGDAVEVVDFINNYSTAVPLAGPANKQGRIAADNIAGIHTTYKGTQGTSIIKIFSLTAANTGSNERTLKRLNIPYKVIFIHPPSHASYYPGAQSITLKLIFNYEGKILGAQAMGYEGVDKRIDVIATVIRLKGTVWDLTELELCYAPPFSSAKDPVNMAGYVAENVLAGRTHTCTAEEFLSDTEKEQGLVLDVRTEMEFNSGHIEGSFNIPLDKLRGRLNELDKNKEIFIYCQVGLRGYIADRILSQKGFKTKNLTGGYKSAAVLNILPMAFQKNSPKNSSEGAIDPDTQIFKSDKIV